MNARPNFAKVGAAPIPGLLKLFAKKEPLLPDGMIVERAEQIETQLFVKATGLEFIGVEPNPDASISAGNRFPLLHQRSSIPFAAMFLWDGEEFYKEPIIGAPPP